MMNRMPLRSIIVMVAGLALIGVPSSVLANPKAKLEVVTEVDQSPGGMTITPNGSIILSLHQFKKTDVRVAEITPEADVRSFPTENISRGINGTPVALDAVLGVQSDKKGIVWMLDNGRRSESLPKLVAWDTKKDKLHRVVHLPPPATVPSSFLNDMAIDPDEPFIYITDPADGKNAALIVVNLETGIARRVLQGHHSVIPESIDLLIDGKKVEVRRPDGSRVKPLAGANPIAIDRKGNWLYFGPMQGRTLYRVATKHLQDEALRPTELNSRVEGYSEKPICDGIAIDSNSNIYCSDLANKAIGVIREKDQKYEIYIRDDRFLWPDALCFGNDGRLYFVASQLHNTQPFNGGKDVTTRTISIFKIKALGFGFLK